MNPMQILGQAILTKILSKPRNFGGSLVTATAAQSLANSYPQFIQYIPPAFRQQLNLTTPSVPYIPAAPALQPKPTLLSNYLSPEQIAIIQQNPAMNMALQGFMELLNTINSNKGVAPWQAS